MEKGEIYFRIKDLWKGTIDDLETKAGLSQGSIGKWKTSAPKIDTLCKVVSVLGCSYDELLSENKGEKQMECKINNDGINGKVEINNNPNSKVEVNTKKILKENKDSEPMPTNKKEILEDLWKKLNNSEQQKVIDYIQESILNLSIHNRKELVKIDKYISKFSNLLTGDTWIQITAMFDLMKQTDLADIWAVVANKMIELGYNKLLPKLAEITKEFNQ